MDNFLFIPRALSGAAFDVAFACMAGVLLADVMLPAAGNIRLTVRLYATLMILAVSTQAWIAAAVMSGSSAPRVVGAALFEVLTGTHAGRTIVASLLCAGVILLCSLLIHRSRVRNVTIITTFAILTCARAASGHAATDGA